MKTECIPQVDFSAGNITTLTYNFNGGTTKVIIRQQKLLKDEIDGEVAINDELVYETLANTFNDFKFKFLRNEYKSYYSKEDLHIYSECRTVANTGIMHCNQNIANTVEIDVSKAYSAAVTKILMIPIFTIFDKWQEYSGEEIKNFHLYVVESKEFNTFFNKSNNLCYGQFLKYFPKDKINY
jgi:hypothetical protein